MLQDISTNFYSGMEMSTAVTYINKLEELREYGDTSLERKFIREMLDKYSALEETIMKEVKQYQVEKFLIQGSLFETKDLDQIRENILLVKGLVNKKIDPGKMRDFKHHANLHFIRKEETLNFIDAEEKVMIDCDKRYEEFVNNGATKEQYKELINNLIEGVLCTNRVDETLSSYEKFLKAQYAGELLLEKGVYIDIASGAIISSECTDTDYTSLLAICQTLPVRPSDLIIKLGEKRNEAEKWRKKLKELTDNEANLSSLRAFLSFFDPKVMGEVKAVAPVLEIIEEATKLSALYSEIAICLKLKPSEELDYDNIELLTEQQIEEAIKKHNELRKLRGPTAGLTNKLTHVLWYKKAKEKLDPTVKLSKEELQDLAENITKAKLDLAHPKYGEVWKLALDTYNKFKALEAKYGEYLKLEVNSLNESQYTQIIEELRSFKQEAFLSQIRLNEWINKIDKIEQLLTACYNFSSLCAQAQIKKVPFASFQKAYETCLSLAEKGENNKFLEEAKGKIGKFIAWKDKYSRYVKIKEGSLKEDSGLFDLETIKKMASEAESYPIELDEELKSLRADIDVCEKSEGFAKHYLETLKKDSDFNAQREELMNTIQQIEKLPLYSKAVLYTLKAHLWVAEAKKLFDCIGTVKKPLEEWTMLFKEREKMLGAKSENDSHKLLLKAEFVEKLVQDYRRALLLSKQVADLKTKTTSNRFTLVDLNLLLELLTKSPVEFQAEVKFVQEVVSSVKMLEEQMTKLKDEKAGIEGFLALSEKMAKMPINLGVAEQETKSIIQSATQLAGNIDILAKNAQKRGVKLKQQIVETILSEYAKLPCRLTQAESLKQQYEHSKTVIAKSKELVKPGSEPKTIDEISQISNDIKDLPIAMDLEEQQFDLDFCRKKYDSFLLKGEQTDEKPTFSSLRALVADYEALQKFHDKSDGLKLQHLKQFIEEAQNDIKAIQDADSVSMLSGIEKELEKKQIDYSEFIVEQRARINLTPNLKEAIIGKKKKLEEDIKMGDVQLEGLEQILLNQIQEEKEVVKKSPEILEKEERERALRESVRANTRGGFIDLFKQNEEIVKGNTSVSVLGEKLEQCLFSQHKDVGEQYREKAAQIAQELKKLSSYPFLSGYVANGKLPLWKLLKLNDSKTIALKMAKIEGVLQKKQPKTAIETSKIPSPQRKLRANLLMGDDGQKETPNKYDPLQVHLNTRLNTPNDDIYDPTAVRAHISISSGNSGASFPRKQERKKRIAREGGKMDFSSDEENSKEREQTRFEEIHASLFDASSITYQPLVPLRPKDDILTNPSSADQESESKTSSDIVPPIAKNKGTTNLIPISFDPLVPPPAPIPKLTLDEAPIGSLLEIWKGTLSSGKDNFKVKMMTCGNIQDYYKIPALVSHIEIVGRAKLTEVIPYLEGHARTPNVIILTGWVTPLDDTEDVMDKYIAELEKVEKCGVIDIKEMQSHIYLLPWNPKMQAFFRRWRINPITELPLAPTVKFAYFIAFKKRESLGIFTEMAPTLVKKIIPIIPSGTHRDAQSPKGSDANRTIRFPILGQAEELSDEEDKQNEKKITEHYPGSEAKLVEPSQVAEAPLDPIILALKDKLASFSPEGISELFNTLDEECKAQLQKVLAELGLSGGRAAVELGPNPNVGNSNVDSLGHQQQHPQYQKGYSGSSYHSQAFSPRHPQFPYSTLSPRHPEASASSGRTRPVFQDEEAILMQTLASDLEYQRKVKNVQSFIESQRDFFNSYMRSLAFENQSPGPMIFPPQDPMQL